MLCFKKIEVEKQWKEIEKHEIAVWNEPWTKKVRFQDKKIFVSLKKLEIFDKINKYINSFSD